MSSYKYTYGRYPHMQKQTRYSYYGLSNKCIPRTIAITDNTKFNVGTLANVYIDLPEQNNVDGRPNVDENNCNKLTNHSYPNDIKAFDKNKELCLNDETKLEPSGCKSCSVDHF